MRGVPGLWYPECDGYRLWADDQVTVGNFGCISPSMNFGERGQMRQRLRAYLPVRLAWAGGLSGRGIPHGPPHWNAGRTADRSRVASPSLTHAPAGRHSLDAAWSRTEALGWR